MRTKVIARSYRRISVSLAAVLLASLVSAVATPPVASGADGPPSVELPVIPSTPLTRQPAASRQPDQAGSNELRGDQPAGGQQEGGGTATATPLAPSATWQVSPHTGDFTWSYPLRVPPAPGGLQPNLALSYRSSAVDGRTSATNNQPSWVGDGWDLSPGFVERSYGSCVDDGVPVGDLCWRSDNATAAYGGSGGMLICCDADGRWRTKSDDGARIERLPGAGNGANDGEHWKITTVDGTQYWFGSQADSRSTWTVPVFGDDTDEPCHQPGSFDTSHCVQAWRWNLDKVVDRNGNVLRYFYEPESNSYGMNGKDAAASYIRGGTLERIDYGLHVTGSATPTGRVVFTSAERCVPGSTCTHDKPDNYPDTSLEDKCDTATCPERHSPTFWSTKRLATVTTQVLRGSSPVDVDRWTLDHQFPDPGSGEKAALWLKAITHTGLVGGSASLPAVTFEGTAYPNRVVHLDGVSPLNRYRVTGVVSEAGGWTSVTYASECREGGPMPAKPETNTLRCFPVRWAPKNQVERTDYFHKYVVAQVIQSDRMSSSTEQVTGYEYLDGAAWHWDASEFTKEEKKTWNEFRGFGRVRIRAGTDQDPAGPVTMTEQRFYRGMDVGGQPPVTVSDSEGGARVDADWLQGFGFESATFDRERSSDLPAPPVVTKTITEPVVRGPTASRGAYLAHIVRPGTTRGYLARESGVWRITRTDTDYDDRGLPFEVDDLGDESTTADDRCARTTYARDTANWLLNLPARTETVAVHCGQAAVFPGHAIADTRNTFDGNGNVTKVEVAAERPPAGPVYVTTGTAEYDRHGRVVAATDALGRRGRTAYAPETGGPVTQTTTTSPATAAVPDGLVTTTTLEPAWGKPTLINDPNNRETEIAYDPLGRTTKVWLANRAKSAYPKPSAEFSYLIRNDALSSVTSSRVGPNGTHVTSHALYDGWLRPRQTQAPAFGGGRLLTDTSYDSQGRAWKSTQPYFNDAAIDTTLWVASDAEIPGHTRTIYDGAGRPTASVYYAGANEKWRATTAYGGDRVHVTPPSGGTATTTISDARSRTVELRRHTTPAPSESFDKTSYSYTPAGQLASVTDPADNTWRYTYDLRGRKIKVEDPDTGTSTMTYDAAGQLTASQDARGVTLAHTYDKLGRRTGLFLGNVDGTKLAEWTYDTVAKGKGQPASATRWVDGNAYVSQVVSYSALYQPTETSLTIPASEGLLAGTYTSYSSYEPDGSLSGVDYPAAGELPAETVNYDYHDLGPVKSSSGGYGGKTFRHVTDTDYTRYGELARVHLGAGTKRAWLSLYYETNTRRLNRSIVDAEVPTPMQSDTHYTRDPAGNITSIADTPLGQSSNVDVQCFRYDHLRRLTDAWTPASSAWSEPAGCSADPAVDGLHGPAPYRHSYTFDNAGNRSTETRHAAAGNTTSTYTYDIPGHAHALGSVTTAGPGVSTRDTFAYTASGQTTTRTVAGTTQRLEWDAEGRLGKVTEGAKETSFVYDANGSRLIRRDPDAVTLYLGSQELRLNRAGGNPTVTRYYTHGGLAVAMRQGRGALTWLAGDHQATTQVAINSETLSVTRRRQVPYGAPRGTAVTWPGERGFVGGTQDASTGLTHLGAREYDPLTGRFISVDPILDLADPQQMNGYAYANHSPVTSSDPDGLIPRSCPDGECRGGHYAPGQGPASTDNPPVNHTPEPAGTGCGARACPSSNGVDPNTVHNGCGARACRIGSVDPNSVNFEPPKPQRLQPATCKPAPSAGLLAGTTWCGDMPSAPPRAPVEPICDGLFNCVWEVGWRAAMYSNPVTATAQVVADASGVQTTPDYVTFDVTGIYPVTKHAGGGVTYGLTLSNHGQLTFNESRGSFGTPGRSASLRLGWLADGGDRDTVNGFLQGDAKGVGGAVPYAGPFALAGAEVTSSSSPDQRAYEYGTAYPRNPFVVLSRTYGRVLFPGW